jgi:hypothetical protein
MFGIGAKNEQSSEQRREREIADRLLKAGELRSDPKTITALRREYRHLKCDKTILLATSRFELADDPDYQQIAALEEAFVPVKPNLNDKALVRAERLAVDGGDDAPLKAWWADVNRRALEHRQQHEDKVAALRLKLHMKFPDLAPVPIDRGQRSEPASNVNGISVTPNPFLTITTVVRRGRS